jgi:hypothetical protein
VPGDEGRRPHDGQGLPPIEPAAEQHQRQASRIVGPARLDLALLIECVECELLTQEQILGRERSSGAQAETQKVDQITQDRQSNQPCAHNARSPSVVDDGSLKSLRAARVSSQERIFLRITTGGKAGPETARQEHSRSRVHSTCRVTPCGAICSARDATHPAQIKAISGPKSDARTGVVSGRSLNLSSQRSMANMKYGYCRS